MSEKREVVWVNVYRWADGRTVYGLRHRSRDLARAATSISRPIYRLKVTLKA